MISAAISIFFSLRTRTDTKLQIQLQAIALHRQFHGEMQKWADAVVMTMTEAIFLCDLDPTKMPSSSLFNQWLATRQKLSGLIDQGRWFLPNEQSKQPKREELAYRGIRQPALNLVLDVYHLLKDFNYKSQPPNRELRDKLTNTKRAFVSEMQAILNPKERQKELTDLLKSIG